MAKAKYHKSQRVFVKPVGTWAHVEAVVPKWVKGCDEPIQDRLAELIVRAPVLMKPLEDFVQHADHEPENLSDDLTKLAQVARRIISEVSK